MCPRGRGAGGGASGSAWVGVGRVDRAAGSFYGLAFGDSLAKPTEFLSVEQIEQRYGDGPDRLKGDPALVTDDTQMALAVAWALRDAAGLTPEALEPRLRERFVAWRTAPTTTGRPA